jgi:PAS domain S-box-containing protein
MDFGRWDMILLFLFPALINIGMFVYVTLFLPRNRTNFAFSIFVLFLGLWQVADGFIRLSVTGELAHEWFRVAWALSLFVTPFAIDFILNSGNFRKRSGGIIFISQFFPSLICMILIILRMDHYKIIASSYWYWIGEPKPTGITLMIYFWMTLQSLFMLTLLWINYKREKRGSIIRRQAAILAIGFTVPVLSGIVSKTLFPFIMGWNTVPITTFLFTFFSIAMLIAMRKYRLLDYSPREQWDKIVQTMQEGLLIVNNKDEVMYANHAFCELLGYDFKEIKGKAASELFLEEGDMHHMLQSAIDKGGKCELQLRKKSGDKIWISLSASPYIDRNGAEIGFIGILTDINTLKVAETRFRALIENAGDIIAMTDKEGNVIYASPALEKITGFTLEDMKGKPSFAIMHPDQIEDSKAVLKKLLENPGVPIPRSNRFLHKNGHYVWLEGTVINLLHDPNIAAIVSNYRDISEKKEIEHKMDQNAKWFKAMMQYGSDACVVMDAESNIQYMSPNNERILGYTVEELVKNRDYEGAHPEDKQMLRDTMAKTTSLPGETVNFEWRRWHKSGKWIWLEGHVTNLLHDPDIKGLVLNYRDITERKLAEEKLIRSERIYKTIASSITGTVIVLLDTDYRYLLLEGDLVEKLGYKKSALLGNKAKDVIPPERFEIAKKDLERVFNGEYFTTEDNRNGMDIITRYVPLLDDHNMVYQALIVTIDVTQIRESQREIALLNKSLEAKVAERTEQLELANKELESFSYSVSHDLRAPLRAIHGYTQILQGDYADKLDDEGKRLMNRVLINSRKMGQLIDELLTFSRLGKKELSRHAYNMKDMVVSVVNELKSAEPGRDITVHIMDLPDVDSDSATIRQVWTNLISNAIKYTKLKPQAIIDIGYSEEHDEVTYYVKDNGAGFDMDYKDKLFGVFQRLHSEEEFEGIGVGLAIVQRIVLKHGGKVWAEGKENHGATFYFCLNKIKKQ